MATKLVLKHETIDSDFTPSSEINGNTKQQQKTPNYQIKNAILGAISNLIRGLKIPMSMVVLACVLMVLHGHLYVAWGASGGVMGGSSFSSGGSSYGGSSSRSSSSYSSSTSSSSSSSTSYTYVTYPSYSGSTSTSYTYPSYSGSTSTSYKRYPSSSSSVKMTKEDAMQFWCIISIIIVVILAIAVYFECEHECALMARERNSIVKIQVGLLGTAKSLQSDLNEIALVANTSTQKGISYVLTETILALLRHPDYFISAYSSVKTKRRRSAGEQLFRKVSIEERAKFNEETLVNLNDNKKHSKISKKATGFHNEFIVVTIVAAIKGVVTLPTIKRSEDLKEALQKLGSIPCHETIVRGKNMEKVGIPGMGFVPNDVDYLCLSVRLDLKCPTQAAEVLWTPQAENDTLSEQELYKDYPLLKPLVDDV